MIEVRLLLSYIGSLPLPSEFAYELAARPSLTTSAHSKPIGFLGNTVHMLATKFHLIPAVGADIESGGYSQLPGGARAEAERRR